MLQRLGKLGDIPTIRCEDYGLGEGNCQRVVFAVFGRWIIMSGWLFDAWVLIPRIITR